MEINLKEIPIQNVVKYSIHLKECQGYKDNGENGVYGMSGRLNIRPIYQREFVYNAKERNAVIDTIRKNFPLNVMYWTENKDGSYEVLDGQQRLISICQYVSGLFSVNNLNFHNLTDDQQEQILNYKLMVYFCEGPASEKLEWFLTINIAGKELTDQEIKNAIYAGPWINNAKRYFSKRACPAFQIGADYLKGVAIRQDYLETILKWISVNKIENYMAEHQHDEDATELWNYFRNVISWVEKLFPKYRREMKGVAFGELCNAYKDKEYNSNEIETLISNLMLDEDVTKKSGIYSYIFTAAEKDLSIRAFSDGQKREAYEKQQGICTWCKEQFEIEDMEADHITPWSKGGKTTTDNCQMLCVYCNRTKSCV